MLLGLAATPITQPDLAEKRNWYSLQMVAERNGPKLHFYVQVESDQDNLKRHLLSFMNFELVA